MIVDNKIYEELNQIISNVEWWRPLSEVRPCNVLEFFVNFFFKVRARVKMAIATFFCFELSWRQVSNTQNYFKSCRLSWEKLYNIVSVLLLCQR